TSHVYKHQTRHTALKQHTLWPSLAAPSMLIDISGIDDLKGLNKSNGVIHMGSLTTHAQVEASDDLPAAMTEAAGWIGDPQVRNRGTVGGSIAHADPASDLPTVLTALGASVNIAGADGTRSVSADDFFVDLFETALGEGEVLTSLDVPEDGSAGSAYAKLFNPASRYAIVGVAAKVAVENGVCTSASVAIGGLTPAATRAASVEAALTGQPLNDDTIAAAAAAVANDLGDDVMGDIHASADYRRSMAPVFVSRAVSKAAERAG
ncbi:MAG: xanthine dehydrogenase family protein subunit M, partial [Chloroflexota bacterium]